jgi:hypothetical protein
MAIEPLCCIPPTPVSTGVPSQLRARAALGEALLALGYAVLVDGSRKTA